MSCLYAQNQLFSEKEDKGVKPACALQRIALKMPTAQGWGCITNDSD